MMDKYNDQQERVLRNSIRIHNALREIDALDVGEPYGIHPAVRIDLMEQLSHAASRVGDVAAEIIPGGA